MRNIAGVLIVMAAISFSAAPLVRAQDQSDSSTRSQQGHVQQHQQLLPPSSAQKDFRVASGSIRRSAAIACSDHTADDRR